jgi:hypothetical protein
MANAEQLAVLKKGVKEWNEWREKNPEVVPDLSKADLLGANLSDANLSSADLRRANLKGARLGGSDLFAADLSGANLSGAQLVKASLFYADLHGAKLTGARLFGTDLSKAALGKANLAEAELSLTILADVNLSRVSGLEEVVHRAPSTIGIDTIYNSKGMIPEIFLRGCGVPESMITFVHSLSETRIHFYSCFISYSSKDDGFAKKVHADLQSKGVRVWFAPDDLRIGDKFPTKIDEAIRSFDKLMLVLSRNSIDSPWVRREVRTALEKEKKEKRTVLFPIRLDDAFMDTTEDWADDIRRNRHVGNFTQWKNRVSYLKAFDRLLRDLKESEAK